MEPCSDRLKHWLLKKARVGSEDINHVYSPCNRSQEYWSLYILVKSFEGKKNGQAEMESDKLDYARGRLGRLRVFQPPGLCSKHCGVVGW